MATAKKRTTKTQFDIYLQHLQTFEILRTGRLTGPKDGPETLDNIWKGLTATLNSCGDGPIRTQVEWKKVFTEWKSATRKKHREKKQLSQLETRLIQLTGLAAVEGLSDIGEIGLGTSVQEENTEKDADTQETEEESEQIFISVIDDEEQDNSFIQPSSNSKKRKRSQQHVSTEQLELFLSYLSERSVTFDELCIQLNLLQGPQKTVSQWQKTFWNWIYKVKRKARKIFIYRYITGGGRPTYLILTSLEERLLQLIGKLTVEGMSVQELGLTMLTCGSPNVKDRKNSKINFSTKAKRRRPTKTEKKILGAFQLQSKTSKKIMLNFVNAVLEVKNAITRLINLSI